MNVSDAQAIFQETTTTPVLTKKEVVYNILVDEGPMTRREIMSLTSYKWSTIYDILYRFEMEGKVHRYSKRIKRGRPWTMWDIKS